MNDIDKTFNKLKLLLEGKTILKLEDDGTAESICVFRMTDGTAFRLHATDLGYWMEEVAGDDGFKSLDSLMNEYGHHMYKDHIDFGDGNNAKITVIDNKLLVVKSPHDKVFVIKMSRLSDIEMRIIRRPMGISCLEIAAPLGDMWKAYFGRGLDINPEECINELIERL